MKKFKLENEREKQNKTLKETFSPLSNTPRLAAVYVCLPHVYVAAQHPKMSKFYSID